MSTSAILYAKNKDDGDDQLWRETYQVGEVLQPLGGVSPVARNPGGELLSRGSDTGSRWRETVWEPHPASPSRLSVRNSGAKLRRRSGPGFRATPRSELSRHGHQSHARLAPAAPTDAPSANGHTPTRPAHLGWSPGRWCRSRSTAPSSQRNATPRRFQLQRRPQRHYAQPEASCGSVAGATRLRLTTRACVKPGEAQPDGSIICWGHIPTRIS